MQQRIVLIACVLIHIQIVTNQWLGNVTNGYVSITLNLFIGISLAMYPLIGWITEVRKYSFQMLKWSFLLALISALSTTVTAVIIIKNYDNMGIYKGSWNTISSALVVVSGLIGLGMFQANAIQFGMDQMIDASSVELSSFIHWYFWCSKLGSLLIYYITIGLIYFGGLSYQVVLLIVSIVLFPVSICGLCLMHWYGRRFPVQQTSRNSLQLIWKVIRYAIKHKYPERRSAFTYWENDIPTRIDLGKDKYGGPFTYEQVEDVKTFFRLLLLILSLFGFHLLGDGYSLSYYTIIRLGCPSSTALALLVANPQNIPLLVQLIGIPIVQFIKNKSRLPLIADMKTTMCVGLVTCVAVNVLQVINGHILKHNDSSCHAKDYELKGSSLVQKCVYNEKCHMSNAILYFSLIPMVLQGISCILIFMTVLEFICAQSPNSMKGLLIGLWYSTLAIKNIGINMLDRLPILLEPFPWNVYTCAKGIGVFTSLCVFFIVCKYYQHRKRNEIINEQSMIEEQYERELLQNDV